MLNPVQSLVVSDGETVEAHECQDGASTYQYSPVGAIFVFRPENRKRWILQLCESAKGFKPHITQIDVDYCPFCGESLWV